MVAVNGDEVLRPLWREQVDEMGLEIPPEVARHAAQIFDARTRRLAVARTAFGQTVVLARGYGARKGRGTKLVSATLATNSQLFIDEHTVLTTGTVPTPRPGHEVCLGDCRSYVVNPKSISTAHPNDEAREFPLHVSEGTSASALAVRAVGEVNARLKLLANAQLAYRMDAIGNPEAHEGLVPLFIAHSLGDATRAALAMPPYTPVS